MQGVPTQCSPLSALSCTFPSQLERATVVLLVDGTYARVGERGRVGLGGYVGRMLGCLDARAAREGV